VVEEMEARRRRMEGSIYTIPEGPPGPGKVRGLVKAGVWMRHGSRMR